MPCLPPSVARGSGGCNAVVQAEKDTKMKPEERLLRDLYEPELRGNALAELSEVPLFRFLVCWLYIPVLEDLASSISSEVSCQEFLLR